MGAYSFSIDVALLDILAETGRFTNFVETGTFHGETTILASKRFKKVWTVEASDELFEQLGEKFNNYENISWAHADSPAWLRRTCENDIEGGTVFWLDAHWCSSEAVGGKDSQCPLLQELESIGQLGLNDVVLIDDARLFTGPPPSPHHGSDWPTLAQVLRGLQNICWRHEIRIINDVIMVFPENLRVQVENYSESHGEDLLKVIWKAREFDKIREAHELRTKGPLGKLKNSVKNFLARK